MTKIAKTTLSSALAALTLGAALVATAAPAEAKKYYYGPTAAGIALGAVALGAAAAAAAAPAYGYGYGYGGCYWSKQPVRDVFGNILYFRNVRVCG